MLEELAADGSPQESNSWTQSTTAQTAPNNGDCCPEVLALSGYGQLQLAVVASACHRKGCALVSRLSLHISESRPRSVCMADRMLDSASDDHQLKLITDACGVELIHHSGIPTYGLHI